MNIRFLTSKENRLRTQKWLSEDRLLQLQEGRGKWLAPCCLHSSEFLTMFFEKKKSDGLMQMWSSWKVILRNSRHEDALGEITVLCPFLDSGRGGGEKQLFKIISSFVHYLWKTMFFIYLRFCIVYSFTKTLAFGLPSLSFVFFFFTGDCIGSTEIPITLNILWSAIPLYSLLSWQFVFKVILKMQWTPTGLCTNSRLSVYRVTVSLRAILHLHTFLIYFVYKSSVNPLNY